VEAPTRLTLPHRKSIFFVIILCLYLVLYCDFGLFAADDLFSCRVLSPPYVTSGRKCGFSLMFFTLVPQLTCSLSQYTLFADSLATMSLIGLRAQRACGAWRVLVKHILSG
jgi:hypothetical protein